MEDIVWKASVESCHRGAVVFVKRKFNKLMRKTAG